MDVGLINVVIDGQTLTFVDRSRRVSIFLRRAGWLTGEPTASVGANRFSLAGAVKISKPRYPQPNNNSINSKSTLDSLLDCNHYHISLWELAQ